MLILFHPFSKSHIEFFFDHSEALTVDLRTSSPETLKSGFVHVFTCLHPDFSRTEAMLWAPIQAQ
jgi:hypothetical protein